MDQAAFAHPEFARDFDAFGEWLLTETGAQKAALRVHRYLPFFLEIEKTWAFIPAYNALLEHFGAENLRRARVPMRWLRQAKNIEANPTRQAEDSNRRRIEALLASNPAGSVADLALKGYYTKLLTKAAVGSTSTLSIRLALRPAASLLQQATSAGRTLPTQADLDQYLLQTPGQKAAITGFTNYLNEIHGLGLVPKVDLKKTRLYRRRALEKQLIHMTTYPKTDAAFLRKWVTTGLDFFHEIKVRGAKRQVVIDENDGGLQVTLAGKIYWLPKWDSNGNKQ
jgi:hypothetical protein